MALQKPLPTEKGVAAEFWVISAYSIDLISGRASIDVHGYTSEQQYQDDPDRGWLTRVRVPVNREQLTTLFEAIESSESTLYEATVDRLRTYEAADGDTPFADATDVGPRLLFASTT